MKSNVSKLLAESRLFLILLALMVVLNFVSDRFLTVDNLTNVLWSGLSDRYHDDRRHLRADHGRH